MKKIVPTGMNLIFMTVLCLHTHVEAQERTGTLTDVDGNTYRTVVYGNLEWMVENLRVTHFNDGTEIPVGSYERAPGSSEDFAVYYMYPGNNAENAENYGLLYTWNVAFDHEGNPPTNPTPKANFGPEGWRVPTREDWATLGATDWDGSVAAFLMVIGIPESFNPQFAGDFNTGGYANFGSRTEYWLPELVMPGQGYGCRWMYIDAAAPTTVVQNQNRNNNCKSVRLVRNAEQLNGLNAVELDGPQPFALFDLTGKPLANGIIGKGQTFPLDSLPPGLYLAKTGNKTVKLVKN